MKSALHGKTIGKPVNTKTVVGKIPILKHNNRIITESAAAVDYITYSYKKPEDFYIPNNAYEKAKVNEWVFFSLMELVPGTCAERYLAFKNTQGSQITFEDILSLIHI